MLKYIVRKLLLGYKASSKDYINKIKMGGGTVGKNVTIFSPNKTYIDMLNLHLITIGSNVVMTGPVTLLTHDYSVFVCNNINNGHLLGKQKPVVIGNNVFIGWGATILAGSEIGDNVVIGAGAVVSGKVQENSVYAGNPAKRVCSIEEYIQKREANQLKEAVDIYRFYYQRFGKVPDKSIFHEYFYLFSSNEQLTDLYKSKMSETGNYDKCLLYLKNHKPQFESYESFCEYAKNKMK